METTSQEYTKQKYHIILEVETKKVDEGEYQSSEELGFTSIAEDLKDYINCKIPYLNVIQSYQEEIHNGLIV